MRLLLLSLACLAAAAAEPAWTVRYAQHADQTAEWTAKGYVPSWTLTWAAPDAPEVTWDEPAPGNARGWLLLGRRVNVAAGAGLSVSFEYRTHCDLDPPAMPRSGELRAFVMTPAAWDALARTPAAAAVLPAKLPGATFMPVHGQGDDVDTWTPSGTVGLDLPPGASGGVVVGVLWGCYHFGTRERGGLRRFTVNVETAEQRRWRFWQALDLARPELARVKAAVDARDEAAATTALAAWLRAGERPVVANPVAPASDWQRSRADETLARTYRLAGCPVYTFPERVVWNTDPFHYDQWAIALNRHFEWLWLAGAWLRTHDDRYATGWAALLDDWVASMPTHIGPGWIEGPFSEGGRNPLSLDAGIRMGQTWFPVFEVFRHAPAVPDATLVNLVRSAWQHAVYLMRPENYRHGSNWGAMESNGLYHLGVMLPEFTDAPRWRETALARLQAELDYQVYPDGAQTELAPGYHGVSLTNFLGSLDLARANHLPVPDAYPAGLERMYDALLKTAMPDLRTPPLNDSGRGGIQGYFESGVRLFPNRPEFAWARSSRQAGQPPAETSLVMPWAGWVVMRSGWGPDDSYLLFDAGPFGTGHQHEDALGLMLYAHGQELITEAGIYAYDTSAWRRYVLSTRGHSTIRVDGQDQNRAADRSHDRTTTPSEHGFRTGPDFDYAAERYADGYGKSADKSVTHRRRVLYVKPRYWLVIDDLTATDAREHTADSQFLLNAPSATVDEPTRVVTGAPLKPGGPRIALVPLNPAAMTVRVVQGQQAPEVLGWLPQGFEQLRPAPAVLYGTRFRGSATLAYALVPFMGEAVPVQAAVEGDTTVLSFADGTKHRVTFTPDRLVVEAGGKRFEG